MGEDSGVEVQEGMTVEEKEVNNEGPWREACGEVYGKLLPLGLVIGPKLLYISRASSWEEDMKVK